MDKNAKAGRRFVRQVIKASGDGSGSSNQGGGYVLPTEGIPRGDLSPGVKQSLDRADAAPGALEAHAANLEAHGLAAIRQDIDDLKNSGTPGTGSGYQPPQGGIPKTDLSQEVQGLLAKAETALQAGDKFSGSYGDLTDVPDSFSPSAHTHGFSDLSQQVQGLLALAESAVQNEGDPVYLADKPSIAMKADLEPYATTSALGSEAQARLEADEELSDRIDEITGSEFSGDYGDLQNIPDAFPPAAHNHVLTDLSLQVRDLLALAETALQEETDPEYTRDKPDIAMLSDLAQLATTAALIKEARDRTDADNTLTEQLEQRMTTAPQDGEVYGASGDTWYVLEVAKRAVIMISEALAVTESGNVITIEQSDFDRLDEFTVDYNGARVLFTKGSPINELYGVGENRAYYKFEFDQINRTITITNMGKLLMDGDLETVQTDIDSSIERHNEDQAAHGIDKLLFATPADVYNAQMATLIPDRKATENINRINTNNGTWIADRPGFVKCSGNGNPVFSVDDEVQFSITGSIAVTHVFPVRTGETVKISASSGISCYFIQPCAVGLPTLSTFYPVE